MQKPIYFAPLVLSADGLRGFFRRRQMRIRPSSVSDERLKIRIDANLHATPEQLKQLRGNWFAFDVRIVGRRMETENLLALPRWTGVVDAARADGEAGSIRLSTIREDPEFRGEILDRPTMNVPVQRLYMCNRAAIKIGTLVSFFYVPESRGWEAVAAKIQPLLREVPTT